MFNGKYELNHLASGINQQFGLSEERTNEVTKKLYAVAKIYPSYAAVCEVWMNTSHQQFSEMEKAFGLFAMGKIFGMAMMIVKFKLKIVFFSGGTFEDKLLKIMIEGRRPIENVVRNSIGLN